MEVTLLDHRFLRAKPSMIAAIGMYLARRMLGGEWVSAEDSAARHGRCRAQRADTILPQNESFIYYSGYTEAQLLVPSSFLLESIIAPDFDQKFVYKKYANKSESSLAARQALRKADVGTGTTRQNSSKRPRSLVSGRFRTRLLLLLLQRPPPPASRPKHEVAKPKLTL